jgi:hypothetical protein
MANKIDVKVRIPDNGSISKATLKVSISLIDGDKMEYLKQHFFSPATVVPDVYRYKVYIKQDDLILGQHLKSDVSDTRFFDHKASRYKKSIVLLLESPHSKEYYCENEEMLPIAPAQGITGNNLHLYISNYIKKATQVCNLNLGSYPIIIVNPIPWQTSLHYVLENQREIQKKEKKEIKEEVWRKIWETEGVQKYFKSRLDRYNPKLFINACTGGKFSNDDLDSTQLNYLVYKYLRDNYEGVPIVNTCHPSSPHFRTMEEDRQPKHFWIV